MKILFVCHEPLPSSSTSTEQLVRAASAMASLGVEVVVTTPARGRGDAERLGHRVADYYGIAPELLAQGLTLAPLRVPGALGGTLHRPYHDVQAARHASRLGVDVVYVRDPIPLAAALAMRLPTVFETYRYDLNTRAVFGPWRAACYRSPKLMGIVTHSELAKRSFVERGFGQQDVLVAHNGYDPPREGTPTRAQARESLGIDPHQPVVVYAGGVSESKGVESLLPVAEALRHVEFVVVGHVPDTRDARWFAGLVDEHGLDNVRSVARVPPAEVGGYLAAADCLLIPTVSAPLTRSRRTVLPMKTFQYLGAARPIVAPDLDDVREILEHGENALLVQPDDPASTIGAVRRVLEDAALAAALSGSARQTADRLGWRPRARRILDFVERRAAEVRLDA